MVKKITTALLATALFVLTILMSSQSLLAEEQQITKGDIIYDKSYSISEYWSENKKVAPMKDGYVFGGWYTSEDGENLQPLKASDIDVDRDGKATNGNAYAKFVPAYVLSIKAQLQAGVSADSEKTHVRIITSIDELNYGNVGFDIWYNNKIQENNESTVVTKAYSAMKKEVNGESVTTYPKDEFGEASSYFAILKIDQIEKVNFNKIIYVRPYWTTLDGTKVDGLAKYVHIEDGYSRYYSVPINLQSGKEVAAGIVTMSYDKDTLEVIPGSKAVEAGRILKELNYNIDQEAGIITFAANAVDVSNKDIADGIYASVRFKVKDGVSAAKSYQFDMTTASNGFANWDEELVPVFVVDYQY